MKIKYHLEGGKQYFRVHILSSCGHACSRVQPRAWPVTVSVAGGKFDEGNLDIKSNSKWGYGNLLISEALAKKVFDIVNLTQLVWRMILNGLFRNSFDI